MAILKCKMCGGDLTLVEGANIAECEFCGTTQTVPNINDEKKANLFTRANRLRFENEFDKAAGIYESIVAEWSDEAEGYWGLCLCKYGIEYVDDPATAKKIPTCHRASYEIIFDDTNFRATIDIADETARQIYRSEAEKIDEIQNKILAIAKEEEPFDIFICYKETDENGERTKDSILAQDIYYALTDKGYKVFFARITLEDKLGQEYEPYIFSALNSAKVMLAIGTKYEYFNAIWVKNEWNRFLEIMKKDKEKMLIPCYRDIDAYDMPVEFRNLQGQDMGKIGFLQDLIRGIEKVVKINVDKEEKTQTSSNAKELNFKDGVYVGEAIGNRQNGWGTYFYDSGNKYEGNWIMGNKDGEGIMYYTDGASWRGIWKNNRQWDGEGTLYYEDGRRYVGEYKNGKITGKGTIYYKNHKSWSGIWKDGYMLDGTGTRYWDGEECTGVWKNGRPIDAQGTFEWNKDWIYSGVWVAGKPGGKGVLRTKNKTDYIEGEFNNGLNGKCVWKYGKGERYEGEISDGWMTGKGVIFYADGKKKYEGELKKGKYHGYGTAYYSYGNCEGTWDEGNIRNGKGVKIYPNNSNIIFMNCDFIEGKANGKGNLYYRDGTHFEGEFLNDQCYQGAVYSKSNNIIKTVKKGKEKVKLGCVGGCLCYGFITGVVLYAIYIVLAFVAGFLGYID